MGLCPADARHRGPVIVSQIPQSGQTRPGDWYCGAWAATLVLRVAGLLTAFFRVVRGRVVVAPAAGLAAVLVGAFAAARGGDAAACVPDPVAVSAVAPVLVLRMEAMS